jgi:hypothetical protein
MGNQGHSEEGLRLMQEWFDGRRHRPGARGALLDQPPDLAAGHAAADRGAGRPDGLDWDLWLGPAPMRPFHKTYHPFGWRAWQDFRRRRHGRHGVSRHGRGVHGAEARRADERHRDAAPINSLPPARPAGFGQRVKYNDSYPPSSLIHLTFPQRGDLPPVKLHWYDGGLLPERPDDLEPERRLPESGTIFVGARARCGARPTRRARASFPRRRCRRSSDRRKTLPRVPRDVRRPREELARRDPHKGQAVSHFDYAGPFTESGAARQRRPAVPGRAPDVGRRAMKVTNKPEADQYIHPLYRRLVARVVGHVDSVPDRDS